MISGTTVAQPVKPVLKSEKDRNGSNEAAATPIKKVRAVVLNLFGFAAHLNAIEITKMIEMYNLVCCFILSLAHNCIAAHRLS